MVRMPVVRWKIVSTMEQNLEKIEKIERNVLQLLQKYKCATWTLRKANPNWRQVQTVFLPLPHTPHTVKQTKAILPGLPSTNAPLVLFHFSLSSSRFSKRNPSRTLSPALSLTFQYEREIFSLFLDITWPENEVKRPLSSDNESLCGMKKYKKSGTLLYLSSFLFFSFSLGIFELPWFTFFNFIRWKVADLEVILKVRGREREKGAVAFDPSLSGLG